MVLNVDTIKTERTSLTPQFPVRLLTNVLMVAPGGRLQYSPSPTARQTTGMSRVAFLNMFTQFSALSICVAACWSKAASSCLDLTSVRDKRRPNSPHSLKKHVTPPCVQRVGGGEPCQGGWGLGAKLESPYCIV